MVHGEPGPGDEVPMMGESVDRTSVYTTGQVIKVGFVLRDCPCRGSPLYLGMYMRLVWIQLGRKVAHYSGKAGAGRGDLVNLCGVPWRVCGLVMLTGAWGP